MNQELIDRTENILAGELVRCTHIANLVLTDAGFCIACWGSGWVYKRSIGWCLIMGSQRIRFCHCCFDKTAGHCSRCQDCRHLFVYNVHTPHKQEVPLIEITRIAVREGHWPSESRLKLIFRSLEYGKSHRTR